MIFHADSESDLKTSPNQVKNSILSKIRFLWYFDLKFPLRKHPSTRAFLLDARLPRYRAWLKELNVALRMAALCH